MIASLLLLASMSSAPDTAKAQQLYEKAKYDKALKTLGDICEKGSEFVACERLRAFILLALGRDAEARAAFHRLLADNPDASLGPDVSPKLQTLFGNAKREVADLQSLELDAIDTKAEPGSLVLKVAAPEGVELKALKAYIVGDDSRSIIEVNLRKEGNVWLGTIKAAGGDKLHYYLVAVLPTDVPVADGSESSPLVRSLPASGGGNMLEGGDKAGGDGHSPFDPPGLKAGNDSDSKALPSWAIWTIVGGAVAVVAVGVTLAIVLTRKSEPGTILVNVQFVNQP